MALLTNIKTNGTHTIKKTLDDPEFLNKIFFNNVLDDDTPLNAVFSVDVSLEMGIIKIDINSDNIPNMWDHMTYRLDFNQLIKVYGNGIHKIIFNVAQAKHSNSKTFKLFAMGDNPFKNFNRPVDIIFRTNGIVNNARNSVLNLMIDEQCALNKQYTGLNNISIFRDSMESTQFAFAKLKNDRIEYLLWEDRDDFEDIHWQYINQFKKIK